MPPSQIKHTALETFEGVKALAFYLMNFITKDKLSINTTNGSNLQLKYSYSFKNHEKNRSSSKNASFFATFIFAFFLKFFPI